MRFRSISVALLIVATVSVRPAAATCTNASFKGVYGFFYGRLGGPSANANAGDAFGGQLTADGLGNLKGSWTQSEGGVITTGTFTGTYSIARNCAGTTNTGAGFDFAIVLDNTNKGFQLLRTDNTHAQPGFGIAQGTVTCGLSGKKQTLALNVSGTDFSNGGNPKDTVGQIVLDGKGGISGNVTQSINFVISAAPVTGTYTENNNCTGTLQITPSGGTVMNFNTVVVDGGKELLLFESDTGSLIAGNAQQ